MKPCGKLLLPLSVIAVMIAATGCNTSSKQSLTASMFAPTVAKADDSATVEGELEVATGGDAAEGQSTGDASDQAMAASQSAQAQPEVARKESPRHFLLASANVAGRHHKHQEYSQLKPKLPSMVGSNLLVRTTAYCHKEADSLPYGRLNAAGGTLQYGGTIRSAAADWSRFPLGDPFSN